MSNEHDAAPPLKSKAKARSGSDHSYVVFLTTLGFYLLSLSRLYIGDGLRYLEVLTGRAPPPPAGASHALYPLLAWVWNLGGECLHIQALLGRFGFEFPAVVWLQALSAIAAALGVMLLYKFQTAVGVASPLALAVCLGVTCAAAYRMAATDMVEPMPAVPFMLGGFLLAVRTRLRGLGGFLAVVLTATGGAIYQLALSGTIVLMGVAWSEGAGGSKRRALGALGVGAGVASAFGAIVATVTLLTARGDTTAIRQLLHPDTAGGQFGQVDLRHLVGAIFGLTNAFVGLRDWAGLSRLFESSPNVFVYNLVSFALVISLLGALAKASFAGRGSPLQTTALLWAGAVSLFAAFWSATYFKIWMFGVLGLAIWTGSALTNAWASLGVRCRLTLQSLYILTFGLSIINGFGTRVFIANPDIVRAKEVAARIEGEDLLVTTGWDAPTVYLRTLIRPRQRAFSLTDEVIALKSASDTMALLAAEAADAQLKGRRVFFLGVLSMSPRQWNDFFGARLGLKFVDFEIFRREIIENVWISPGRNYRLDEVLETHQLGLDLKDGPARREGD